MPTKEKPAKSAHRKLVFIQTDEDPEAIKGRLGDKKLETVELWIRTPDIEEARPMVRRPRLCSCRNVCIAVAP